MSCSKSTICIQFSQEYHRMTLVSGSWFVYWTTWVKNLNPASNMVSNIQIMSVISKYFFAVQYLGWCVNGCVGLHTRTPVTDCDRLKSLKKPTFTLHPHSQLLPFTHTHKSMHIHWDSGHWGNDNKDMLMCANDVVISWRVQMEREINTEATGNEVWVHWHVCVCEWDVLEEVAVCVCVCVEDSEEGRETHECVSLPPFQPHFPLNFDLLRLLSIPQEDTHSPREWMSVCMRMCICMCCFPNKNNFLESALHQFPVNWKHCANHKLSCSCHRGALTSLLAFLSFGRTAPCFHKLASWTPTHGPTR